MPTFAGAFVLRDATVTIDDVEYANQCTKARLVPDTPIQTLRTLVPDGVIQDVDSSVWTFELTGVASKIGTGSLVKALRDASGTQVECVLTPQNGVGNETATFSVVALPTDFGGDQGNINTVDISLPVVGQPIFGTVAAG